LAPASKPSGLSSSKPKASASRSVVLNAAQTASASSTCSGETPRSAAAGQDTRRKKFYSPLVALIQRAQGLGERPLQPGEVVSLAVMVRGELVGPADRGVPYVFAGPLDQRPDIPDAFGVGHRPVAAAGDVDRRGVGENPATPFIEVVIGTERSAGYPRVPVDPQFLADLGLPSAVGFCPRNDLAVTHDFERTERENAAHRGMDTNRSRPGKVDGTAGLAPVDRERHQRPAGKERATRPHRPAPGLIAELLVQPRVRAVEADRHG